MIVSTLLVGMGIILITLIGYCLIRKFQLIDLNDVEMLPFSFGLGGGIIALQLFIYSRLELHWSIVNILSPGLILLLLSVRSIKFRIPFKKVKLSKIAIFLLFLILILASFVGFEAVIRPLSAWDGWATWLFKAKAFYADGNVDPALFLYMNSDYPYLVSLVSAFLYVFIGWANDQSVLLLFFSFYSFLGIAFFFSLLRNVGIKKSLIFTFLLLASQNIVRHGGRFEAGYVDLALGFYIFMSFELLLRYVKSKKLSNLIILNLFLGFTALIKNEGLPFSIIAQLVIIFHILKFKQFSYLLVLLFWAIPILDWNIFKFINHLPQNYLFSNTVLRPERIAIVIKEISSEFLNIGNWNLLWLVFFTGFLAYLFLKKSLELNISYIIIFFQLLVYIIVFLLTPVNPALHIKNVADRLLIHLAPLAVFTIAMIFSKKSE